MLHSDFMIHSFDFITNISSAFMRILISSALTFGQTVFIADAGHQIPQTGDPGASLLSRPRHQVQRLHVLTVIDAEAAVGIPAAVGISLKDVGLLSLAHFTNRVDRD